MKAVATARRVGEGEEAKVVGSERAGARWGLRVRRGRVSMKEARKAGVRVEWRDGMPAPPPSHDVAVVEVMGRWRRARAKLGWEGW